MSYDVDGNFGVQQIQAAFFGISTGILLLLMWYLVYGQGGLSSLSQQAFFIPGTMIQLHHEVLGAAISAFGFFFYLRPSRASVYLGTLLIFLGGTFFVEDTIQHCVVSNLQSQGSLTFSCSNWP